MPWPISEWESSTVTVPSGATRTKALGSGGAFGGGPAARALRGTWKAITSPAPEISEERNSSRRLSGLIAAPAC